MSKKNSDSGRNNTVSEDFGLSTEFNTDSSLEALTPEGRDPTLPESLKKAVSMSFNLLEAAYPTQFRNLFADPEKRKFTMRVWAIMLRDIPDSRWIAEAVTLLCQEDEYFPNLSRVRRRTLQLAHRAPHVHEAYLEACHKAHEPGDSVIWSCLAVKMTAHRVGIWELCNKDSRELRPVFEKHYWTVLGEMHPQKTLN